MARLISFKFLRLSLGFFFIILGIIGLIPNVQESVFTLNDRHGLEIAFGIVEVACGLLLIAGIFTFMRKKVVYAASLVVLIFWAARIFLSKIIWGLSFSNHGLLFIPQFSTWLLVLAAELVIASALFVIFRAYE